MIFPELLPFFERQPAFVHQLLDQGGEVDDFIGQFARSRQRIGLSEAFEGADELVLQRYRAGGAGRDDIIDIVASSALMLSFAFCAATS